MLDVKRRACVVTKHIVTMSLVSVSVPPAGEESLVRSLVQKDSTDGTVSFLAAVITVLNVMRRLGSALVLLAGPARAARYHVFLERGE